MGSSKIEWDLEAIHFSIFFGHFFFNMGSLFSILNDTKEELYMTHYNCQAALWGSIGAVLAVTTGGIATVGILAGAAATKWLTADKIKDLGLKLIKPGEKYSFSGTLSLVKTALVLSKDGSMKGSRDVWTGPTDGSNIESKVSQDFDMAPIQQ